MPAFDHTGAILFEILAVTLFAITFKDAFSTRRLSDLVGATIFGFLIEIQSVLFPIGRGDDYYYGNFTLSLAGVPVAVGIMWGVIIYTAMRFAEGLKLHLWQRVAVAALYAIAVDLSMDAIAIRLRFWTWSIDLNEQWFGVPYSNFIGWMLMVGIFSWLTWRLRSKLRWAAPLVSAFLAFIILGLPQKLWAGLVVGSERDWIWFLALMVLAIGSALVGWRNIVDLKFPIVHPVRLMPLAFHLFFTAVMLAKGMGANIPLLAVTIVAALAGVFLVEGFHLKGVIR
ncbi:MAG: carotenoid biosynthesis protein [Actinobacteria bacterium]|nr:carotenoid biosynthesis protein [Actinomycetota bacterium]